MGTTQVLKEGEVSEGVVHPQIGFREYDSPRSHQLRVTCG